MYIANVLKKLAAILLSALFTFNLFGYRILFYIAQQQSDNNIERVLDRDQYDEKDLVTIKIPMSVSYQVEQRDFERVDGEVTLNGRIYKFVKRKVCDGNLVLLCLPDQTKMHLQSAKDELFKYSIDLQNSGSKKTDNSKSIAGKNFSDYNQHTTSYQVSFENTVKTSEFSKEYALLSSALHSSPEQPPELI
jgi:hypothetical protein